MRHPHQNGCADDATRIKYRFESAAMSGAAGPVRHEMTVQRDHGGGEDA